MMSSSLSLRLPRAVGAAVPSARSAVRAWAFAVAALIFLMTIVGGATRLTESGLSITQWKPISGVVPPLSQADWQAEFDGYKQIPQFKLMRPDMTLSEFKAIFWWEWAHRFLARVIGAAFILPALWFWARGALWGAPGRWIALATGFLALEPIVGWWMVASGLADRVEVAPQRLAMHLAIAAATFAALLAAAEATLPRPDGTARSPGRMAGIFALLVFIQLGLGALAAGLRAGLIDNTWPLMEGQWIPGSVFPANQGPAAIFEDATTAQFDHRLMAYIVLLACVALAASTFLRPADAAARRRAAALVVLAFCQAGLGIATLLFMAPAGLALPHQALALALFGATVWNWRRSAAA
jgi:cytochrome c oxidase assembly protein subunit 15